MPIISITDVRKWSILALAIASTLSPIDRADGQATGPSVEAAPLEQADEKHGRNASPKAALRFDLIASNKERRINHFLQQMTLEEKVGQLVQVYPADDALPQEIANQIRAGEIGSVFYPGNRKVVEEAQRIAREESRLGIPLLIARDVVHGLRTVFPIPLGQAATWNPELVEKAARIAAMEAKSEQIDWTFAPMVDICRDSRWGRVAETLGEDPYLAGELAASMVKGFQQEEDGKINGVVACAKHFVGYGFSEGGRDYNRVSLSPSDLHNVALPPFQRSVDAGVRTLMTTFSSVNGVPGTAHRPLLRGVLKRDWDFSGFVVSDWASVTEMIAHGYARDERDAAEQAITAGVDMDMCSPAFAKHLAQLVRDQVVPIELVDDAVRRVLRCKIDVADRPHSPQKSLLHTTSLAAAREAARQSIVMLKNDGVLPLDVAKLKKVAVIGPMANSPRDQLGCWSLDGRAEDSVTPLADLQERLKGLAEVTYTAGTKSTFDEDASGVAAAVKAASAADVALLFVGEDAVLSGEARCRTTLDLPGVQRQLIQAVAKTGVPTVVVFLAGRPLTIAEEVEASDGVLFAWHPGTMAGPAIGDLLFGVASPSGKLPVTFPRSVGQTPIYYNHTNTGRPSPKNFRPLVGSNQDDLPLEFQYRSTYLDEDFGPLFPFGFGLSYTTFDYTEVAVSASEISRDEPITVTAAVTNTGDTTAEEVVQLYLRDAVARRVRPVRELKAFKRIRLKPSETRRVAFVIDVADLSYLTGSGLTILEPGRFEVGVGGDSTAELVASFQLLPASVTTPAGRPFSTTETSQRLRGYEAIPANH